ncbi:glycoside hydrolase family 2 protein [Microbacterium sp. XT11]|uniref:glycoside hydrolase family 2 protein n=1 Tax=Microbacterium sp. XT11 TaxID=367477 RepID=UPI00074314B0|nr:glycoside hydrolase family 2 protein [Microbacterium sp. XT11]ALX65763.1 beta-galactosidase/beta-glucuronidase [Microbacterium sp. XT11]
MSFRELDAGWTLSLAGGEAPEGVREALTRGIPARVPGVVHTDLLAAALIDDPYVDDNESAQEWIGYADWEYAVEFDHDDDGHARYDLVADGLDTVATVSLNGTEVARTVNQHREYRWPVAELLRTGRNELRIAFRSPIAYAREREAVLGERPHSYVHPFNAIRKSACNFGWDWGPALVTAGIWRRIGIEGWSGARIARVRPVVGVDGDPRRVDVHVDVEREGAGGDLSVTAAVAGVAGEAMLAGDDTSAVIRLHAKGAALWHPRGYGAPDLHELVVRLGGDETWAGRIGLRTVELDASADEHGSGFRIIVNGEPVYVRGANWIPEDTFFPRVTRERLAERFDDATQANMNLLRVWGGGIYESEDFYALADERGILVWQDFLLACAAYSEDEELWKEFEAEARDAVARLTAHPSLVLWNGGNENIWGWVDWHWRERLQGATWGEGYYQELFPRVVAELAPTTPYSPGSPYGFSRYVHPNDPAHGTMHIWDVWNRVDYDVYRDYTPRFVSEFGFQGPPAWSTLFSVVHDEPADPYGPLMLVHQKAADGNGKLERGLGTHIAAPRNIDDWHWATQLNQARAVRFGIEHFRSLHPINQGAIVWQLNDCWPVISWAAVDGHGIRKPLWHALRAAYADRLATIQPRAGQLALVLHNDTGAPWEAELVVRTLTLDGVQLDARRSTALVSPRSASTVELDPALDDPHTQFVVAELSTGERAFWYGAEDTRLQLDRAAVHAVAAAVEGGYRVRVAASSLAKDVTLLVDRAHADARVDRSLVTVLPGEEADFLVRAPEGLDPAIFTDPLVVRSANDLVHG